MRTKFAAKSARAALFAACVLIVTAGGVGCGGSSAGGTAPALGGPLTPGVVAARQLAFRGITVPYFLYVPRSAPAGRPLPALLMVHGAGGNGKDFIHAWQTQAETSGIALVAPTVPLGADFEPSAPALFRALMEATKTDVSVDPKRLYVFGYSAGGYVTFDAAMFDSEYFAGVGVFAGIITPDYDSIVTQATRKTPIALYLGDHDQFFTLAQGRRTRDLLVSHQFPVHYVELAHQDHNYGAVEDAVNHDCWVYLSQFSLP